MVLLYAFGSSTTSTPSHFQSVNAKDGCTHGERALATGG